MSAVLKVAQQSLCYHCGSEHPGGNAYSLVIKGEIRSMCCPGCQCAAEMIEDLNQLYRQPSQVFTKLSE